MRSKTEIPSPTSLLHMNVDRIEKGWNQTNDSATTTIKPQEKKPSDLIASSIIRGPNPDGDHPKASEHHRGE